MEESEAMPIYQMISTCESTVISNMSTSACDSMILESDIVESAQYVRY